jgi:glycine dehydrogenase subunit 2
MRNQQATRLLFELSQPGRRAARYPVSDVPEKPLEELIPSAYLAQATLPLPEVTEPDVIRHFVNLSTLNMSVDTHFYPLGSCTMKYNPKRHERLASLAGIADLHPYQTEAASQGMLELLYQMQQMLGEIAGLPGVSLQPAAGAQGELTALLVAAKYFRDKGEKRTKVIFPNSAHGTNPASAAIAGFECVQLTHNDGGYVNLEELQSHLNDQTAVFMITNPSTLGLFERRIASITKMVHDAGGLVYIDGANMNAILGITRPGDFGGDMMHYNVHKTFTGPHGAGGPGSGPIAVRDFLADYLPGPIVTKTEQANHNPRYELTSPPKAIGRMRTFFGNVGILVRGYCYLKTLGAAGLKDVSDNAVLNANYLLQKLKHILPVPQGESCMHEFVASAQKLKAEKGITAMDIAKRLLDYGFHAPTVYFPLVVPEALMMEPTETESKETLDAFAAAIEQIITEDPALLRQAPFSGSASLPDDLKAARNPILKWTPRT